MKHRRKKARLSELALVHKQVRLNLILVLRARRVGLILPFFKSVNPPRLRRAFRSGSSPPPVKLVSCVFLIFLILTNPLTSSESSRILIISWTAWSAIYSECFWRPGMPFPTKMNRRQLSTRLSRLHVKCYRSMSILI